jgi:hypothetical protein
MTSKPQKIRDSKFFNESNQNFIGEGYVINGSNNRIQGLGHVVNGNNNTIFANSCVVNGSNNKVNGDNCKVTGSNNIVVGAGCAVKGSNNTWNGNKVANIANESGGIRNFFGGSSMIINYGNMVGHNTDEQSNVFYGHNFEVQFRNAVLSRDRNNDNNNNNNRNRDRDRDDKPKEEKTTYPDDWKDEPEEAREGKEKCVICLTREVSVIALPCAHISLCVKCCRKNRKTPAECVVCKTKVTKYQRVFINGSE